MAPLAPPGGALELTQSKQHKNNGKLTIGHLKTIIFILN